MGLRWYLPESGTFCTKRLLKKLSEPSLRHSRLPTAGRNDDPADIKRVNLRVASDLHFEVSFTP